MKVKNLVSVLAIVLLILSQFNVGAIQVVAMQEEENEFTYNVLENEIEITGYTGSNTTISIPDTIADKPVTKIRDSAFYNKGLTGIEIPNSIQAIGQNAFKSNQLTGVRIPGSITTIGSSAFAQNELEHIYFQGNHTADTLHFISNDTTIFANQIKNGSLFGDWYIDSEFEILWDRTSSALVESMGLHAKWNQIIATVSFETNTTTTMDSILLTQSTQIQQPVLNREGYEFLGWYKDASFVSAWNFSTDVVKADMTLYAKWQRVVHQVRFETNGGTAIEERTIENASLLKNISAPTKAGYLFAGWYKEASFTTEWNILTDVVTADMTLYARWKLNVDIGSGSSTPVTTSPFIPNGTSPVATLPGLGSVPVQITSAAISVGSYSSEIQQLYVAYFNRPADSAGLAFWTNMLEQGTSLPLQNIMNAFEAPLSNYGLGVNMPEDLINSIYLNLFNRPVAASGAQIGFNFLAGVNISLGLEDLRNANADLLLSSFNSSNTSGLVNRAMDQLNKANLVSAKYASTNFASVKYAAASAATITRSNLQNIDANVQLPIAAGLTPAQMQSIKVYMEHGDGSFDIESGSVIQKENGQNVFQFKTNHFSTFILIYDVDAIEPEQPVIEIKQVPYINGYADGSFKPNAYVTRAQMATMMARFITNGTIPFYEATFLDTFNSDAKDAIEEVKSRNLFTGKSATIFDPNGYITRAQMAKVVARWIDTNCAVSSTPSYCQKNDATKSFTDVPPTHSAANAIAIVSEHGIMTGKAATTFDPNSKLTRAQAVKVLNRLFERESLPVKASSFTDVPSSHWAIGEIEAAAR